MEKENFDAVKPASSPSNNELKAPEAKNKKSKSGGIGSFGAFILFADSIVLLIIVVFLISQVFGLGMFGMSSGGSMVGQGNYTANNNDSYQAVFLTNGQVYFGKITSRSKTETYLSDIFYLQVVQPLQQATEESMTQPNLSLVELGDELHSPKNMMMINNDHILFIEELKDDGKVVSAIMEHKAAQIEEEEGSEE